jgi:hypothetical protein
MRVVDRLFRKDSSPGAVVEPAQGYCFRCKARREMKNPTRVWMKNGKPRIHCYCSVCNARMSRLVKA